MRDWFSIKNEAEVLRIDIYGRIGKSFWDDDATSAKDVLDAIKDANGRRSNCMLIQKVDRFSMALQFTHCFVIPHLM